MPKNKASAAKDFLSCLCKKVENAAKEDSKVRKIGSQIWSGLNGVQLIVKIIALTVEYIIIGAIVHLHWWPALIIAQITYCISPDASKSKTDKEMHKKYGDPNQRHMYVNDFKRQMKKIHNLLYDTSSTDKITDPKKIKFFEPEEFHKFRFEMAKFYGWYYNWLVKHYKSSKIHRKMEKIIFHNAIQTRYRYEKKQKKKQKPSEFYVKAIELKQGIDHWVSPEMLILGRGELLIDPDTHIEPMSHKQIKERYFTNINDTEASGIYEWCHKEWTLETKWRSKIAEVLRDGPSLEYLEAHHQSWILRYYRFTEQEVFIQHLKAIMPIPLAVCYLYLIFFFNVYDEIQSWMIGYGIWIIFYTCLQEIGILLIDGSKLLDLLCGFKRMPLENFMETLWIPFGVSVDIRRVKNEQWIYLMVSLFPGLIAGYVANYLLEEKYQLLCNSSIDDDGTNICQGNVCCKLIGSHKEWITFVSGLATSILAAWGLVKLVALLILRGDDRYQEMDDKVEEEEQEAIKLEKEELNEELDDEDDNNDEDDYEDDEDDDDDEDPSEKVSTCCSFFTATAKVTGNKQAIKIAKTLQKVQNKGYVQKLENKGYDFLKKANKKKKKKKRVFSFEKKHYSKWKPKDVVQFICYSLEDEKYKKHKTTLLKKMKEKEFKGLYLKHMDKTDLFLFGITSYAEAVDISHGIKDYIKKQDHEREHDEHKHSDDDGYSSSGSSVSSSSFSSSSSSGSRSHSHSHTRSHTHSHHSHHHHHHHSEHSHDKNSSTSGTHSHHSHHSHHHHHHGGHHHHHHSHHHGHHDHSDENGSKKVDEIKYENGENEQIEPNSKNEQDIELVIEPNENQQN